MSKLPNSEPKQAEMHHLLLMRRENLPTIYAEQTMLRSTTKNDSPYRRDGKPLRTVSLPIESSYQSNCSLVYINSSMCIEWAQIRLSVSRKSSWSSTKKFGEESVGSIISSNKPRAHSSLSSSWKAASKYSDPVSIWAFGYHWNLERLCPSTCMLNVCKTVSISSGSWWISYEYQHWKSRG